jgi:hypothetical protein
MKAKNYFLKAKNINEKNSSKSPQNDFLSEIELKKIEKKNKDF